MRGLTLGLALAVGFTATSALAVDDPILSRKKLMQASGGAVGTILAMVKGEADFNPAIARSALATLNAVAYTAGDYFPEGSDQGDTKAHPNIWQDMAGFEAAFANFQQVTDEARASDPQDVAALQAAMGPIGRTCGTCHEDYRIPDN